VTPLEILILAHQMRESQKRWPDHPQQASIETMALEKRFDEAIEPYLMYAKAVAMEEEADT
jgi:hypothetical protein